MRRSSGSRGFERKVRFPSKTFAMYEPSGLVIASSKPTKTKSWQRLVQVKSGNYAEVQGLYAAAGLNLSADLTKLKNAQRIAADPGALTYLSDNIIFNGQISVPVVSLHTTGDGLVPVEDEKAYSTVVHDAGNSALLRETFVHRAGHCEFTPAEIITAFETLDKRLRFGRWQDLSSTALNAIATGLGPT